MSDAFELRRRWYHPTPGYLVAGLLAVEGLLWLSERFQWLAFNEKKGYTVLIAVASVGAAMLLMLFWLVASLLFRWRFQFSIRSLLVLVVAVAVPCSWMAVEMKHAREEHKATELVRNSGGVVRYDYQFDASGNMIPNAKPQEPAWLRTVLGNNMFSNVVELVVVCDAQMEQLKHFPKLERICMVCDSNVTETGLAHLRDAPQLRELSVGREKQFTDASLAHLRYLTNLENLCIEYLDITDEGLQHLKGLTQLQTLILGDKVTDKGVNMLQQALPNCQISH
jgi:hypothetical protein